MEFLWALRHGAIPAGRITSNAGAQEHKPATSTINCTVSGTIQDSMNDILNKVHEAGLTLKAGCGIGYEFSTLRPRGAYVSGAGAYTSGPLSFMDIYDKMCFTVSSAGGRRGAQMATFDVGHPDVMDFVRAKREDGRLRQFNLSLLITDEFMQAVINEEDWKLAFPVTPKEVEDDQLDVMDIPTNRPLIRIEMDDQIYRSEKEKYGAVVDEVARVHATGRPILVGTASVDESEQLASAVRETGIECEVLNAARDELEARIVADADGVCQQRGGQGKPECRVYNKNIPSINVRSVQVFL